MSLIPSTLDEPLSATSPSAPSDAFSSSTPLTFTFDYLPLLSPLFFLLRLNAHCSRISLDADALTLNMGWAFSASIPLAAVRAVTADAGFVGGIGVHGFGSAWLVNGSHRNIARVELAEPGARACVCGVPVTLRTLRVGVAERDDFIAALRARARGGDGRRADG